MDQNQTKPADLTTATSPFLGHRKDLSLPQTLHKAKYSLLIQSPGNAKISLIDFSAVTTASWLCWRLRRDVSPKVAVEILLERAAGGGGEDKDRSGPDGIRHEQTEKSLERNMRRSCMRKESARAICEVKCRGGMAGVIVTESSVWLALEAPAVDFEKEDVAKYRNVFSFELGPSDI